LQAAPELALGPVAPEALHIDADRETRLALFTGRPVGEQATAAETLLDQAGVGGLVDQMGGCGDLGAGHASGQVAAWVAGRDVELQAAEDGFAGVAHETGPGSAGRTAMAVFIVAPAL